MKVLLIAAVAMIGLVLRVYAANHLVIVQDEPIYAAAGVRYARHMRTGQWNMLAWQDKNLEHPVLYKILYGFVELALPEPKINTSIDVKRFSPIEGNVGQPWVMAGRYTSVVIGVLTVVVMAILSPIAGLLLAVQSIAVLYTSTVYLEALPFLGSLLCAIFYLKWFDAAAQPGAQTGRRAPRPLWWLFLSSGALGATAASKYIYCVVGLAIAAHYLIFAARNRTLRRTLGLMIGWGLFALFAFFVFDPYLWPHPKERLLASLTYHYEYTQSDDVTMFSYPFWQVFAWLSGSVSNTLPEFKQGMLLAVDLPISLLALAGLPRLWKKSPLYVLWLGLGILVLFAWPTKWTQYTMIILAPYCFSAAESLNWLGARLHNRSFVARLEASRLFHHLTPAHAVMKHAKHRKK